MDVAIFGVMSYELNLLDSSHQGLPKIKEHIQLYKKIRLEILNKTFYQLKNSFENNISGW